MSGYANPEVEIRQLLAEHGFVLQRETKHQVWKNPQGKIFVCSSTPSNNWAAMNALGDLRRIVGWKPQPKPKREDKPYRKRHAPLQQRYQNENASAARPTMREQLAEIFKKSATP